MFAVLSKLITLYIVAGFLIATVSFLVGGAKAKEAAGLILGWPFLLVAIVVAGFGNAGEYTERLLSGNLPNLYNDKSTTDSKEKEKDDE